MAPLLEDPKAKEFDVPAVQETSRNGMNGTSYNPANDRRSRKSKY